MPDIKHLLPFSHSAMTTALKHLICQQEREELTSRQLKLTQHLQSKPVINQSKELAEIMQRSIRFTEDLYHSGVRIPYLVAGSTCRFLTFKGHSASTGKNNLPVLNTRLTNFSLEIIGKECHYNHVSFDSEANLKQGNTWVKISSHRDHTSFTAIGPAQTIIDENLILKTSQHSGYANTRSGSVQLLLPLHGDNLFHHRPTRELSEKYLKDVPYERIQTAWDNEKNTHEAEKIEANLYVTKKAISEAVTLHEDYREIMELNNPLRDYSNEDMTKICAALRHGLTRIPSHYVKLITDIFTRLSAIPDEEDRAIVWIGITNGSWDFPV